MKKTFIMVAACSLLLSACGGISGMAGTDANTSATTSSSTSTGNVLGNIFSSVIGLDKLTQKSIIKTWKYNGPGVAFTSENLLAKAGGEIAANKIEESLSEHYNKLGMSASNTYIEFKEDGTFAAKIKGKSWNGTYTFSESNGQLQLHGLLLTNGISLLFESKKLLTLIQTMSALSGSQQASAISEIAKNYDGVRLGFDLK